jgi:DNA-binding CsgD family transcriptional regulator
MVLGRMPEAVRDAREALDVARSVGYQAGEVLALAQLSRTAHYGGDASGALEWARQVQRALVSGELGWTMRFAGHFFTEVLIESGDTAAARRSIADSLAWAREAGDQLGQASDLALMADLDLRTGNTPESGRHLREAIEIAAGSGEYHRLTTCLDLCAHLSAARGQWAETVTLWAAVRARREAEGTLDTPLTTQRRQEPLRKATQALGPASTRAAEERGAEMTLETATEFALMLADTPQAPRSPQDPEEAAGFTPLSAREQELVTLVAKGRTDAQIASQLFISISTVRSHLDRIRDKTSCRRRADLTRLALQAGLA